MKKNSVFLMLLFVGLFLSSCVTTNNTPITTIKDQTVGLHKTIEKVNIEKYGEESYQSLSFGKLKVFKPEAFVRLDSAYAIKQKFLNNNDLRGLHNSGIDDLIPGYRAEAMQHIEEVQYEIEHIYQVSKVDSFEIHTTFYLFDYNDSLINISPLYDFKIHPKHKDLFYAYQFNYHFVTNRNLYVSEAEWEFFKFFKNREIQLIGTDELQSFMDHTMNLMEASQKASTVDFRSVSKILVLNYFKDNIQNITIEEFGQLIALEKNNEVIGYESTIKWTDENSGLENTVQKESIFSFNPYLEITSINTQVK